MSGRPSAATEKALLLVQKGMPAFRAAKKTGIAPSTIYRALARKPVTPEEAMPREVANARRLNAEGSRYAKRRG